MKPSFSRSPLFPDHSNCLLRSRAAAWGFRFAKFWCCAVVWSGAIALLPAEDELVLVSPHWEGVKVEFAEAFQTYYQRLHGRTITVRWRDLGGTSQIEQAVDALYQATPTTCDLDVFFGGGMDPYENQKKRGHLQPFRLPEEILRQLPRKVQGANLIDPDYTYYGAALASFGILQNVPVCQKLHLPTVASWEDLTQPYLAGWVSGADPRKSGSVHMIYEIILQAYGWDRGWSILYRLGGNMRSFLPDSAGPPKEVAAGDAAYALTIDINGFAEQSFLGPESVRFFIPAKLSIINPDGIAIFKGAPHLAAARDFLTFVLSTPGQSLWMLPTGAPGGARTFGINRLGVLPALYEQMGSAAVPLNPFRESGGFRYENSLGSSRWSLLNSLMGQTMIDILPELQGCWQSINRLPPQVAEPLRARFAQPMITQEEAVAMAPLWQKDPVAATRLADQWMSLAVHRFHQLRSEARRLGRSPAAAIIPVSSGPSKS